jgi:hypothetical protein
MITEKHDNSVISVMLTVAISETGRVRCCLADSMWIADREAHTAFMKEIREDKFLWTVKTIKTAIRMPFSYEDIGVID